MKASSCLRCALLAMALCFLALPLSAGPRDTRLAPRRPADKHGQPSLPAATPIEWIVVKFHEGTRVRLRAQWLVALPRDQRESARLDSLGLTGEQIQADLHSAHALLASSGQARGFERLFSAREEVLAARRATGEARSGRELADLDLYFRIRVVPGTNAGEVGSLVDDLNVLATVEIAYAQPPATPPVDIPPPTPNFEGSQGYLDPAPLGIDARYGWTLPGGLGEGVRIVDVEGAWNTTHEDLPPLFYQGGVQTTIPGWLEHGTAVLGEIGSRIDVHAWGWDVTTTGYGTLFDGGGDPNQYYTSTFSGTSSASPIVTGAAANLQGVALAHGLGAQTPADVRQRLRDTGTPQASDPRLIGPQPDLRAAIDQLLSCGPLNLELANQSISSTQTFVACDTIFAGPNLTIEPSGNATLQAGQRVVLGAVFKAAIP